MTLNLVETFKTSIYNPKHTKNTKIYFDLSNSSKMQKSIFSNKKKFKQISIFG